MNTLQRLLLDSRCQQISCFTGTKLQFQIASSTTFLSMNTKPASKRLIWLVCIISSKCQWLLLLEQKTNFATWKVFRNYSSTIWKVIITKSWGLLMELDMPISHLQQEIGWKRSLQVLKAPMGKEVFSARTWINVSYGPVAKWLMLSNWWPYSIHPKLRFLER